MAGNEELARSTFQALFGHDFETWGTAFDPDMVYVPTKEWPDPAPRRGNGDRVLVETRVNAVGATSGIELREMQDFIEEDEALAAAGLAT